MVGGCAVALRSNISISLCRVESRPATMSRGRVSNRSKNRTFLERPHLTARYLAAVACLRLHCRRFHYHPFRVKVRTAEGAGLGHQSPRQASPNLSTRLALPRLRVGRLISLSVHSVVAPCQQKYVRRGRHVSDTSRMQEAYL